MKLLKITIIIGIMLISAYSFGMGQEHFGPADKDHMSWSPDWPDGTKALLAHKSRVYSTWSNGFERFYFAATPEQINELLELFSKLQILDHEVWIESGRQTRNSFQGKPVEYNAFFYIPARRSAPSYLNLSDDEDQKDGWTLPTLRIYTDSQEELLKQLKLPNNLIVHSDIPNCPKTNAQKPLRKPYVIRFLLEDGTPASGMGFRTKITLWKKGKQRGDILGIAGFQGISEMFFSDDEMAKLRSGDTWLTATYGNDQVTPKPTDQKIPVEHLVECTLFHQNGKERPKYDSDEDFVQAFNEAYSHAKTFVVKKASSIEYYGRLVYEDDGSGVNGSELAPREIMITMPWQVIMEVDKDGYFKVIYSEEQIDQLIKKKAKGTVIIPRSGNDNEQRSTANVKFTLDILSADKAKAGVVKIPRS